MPEHHANRVSLQDLPNIGQEVARLLEMAGIRTPRELARLGAVAAALRIRRLRPDDPPCRSMVAGLEGAVRGVRWHALPKEEREALWREYESRAGAARRSAPASRRCANGS